MNISCVKQFMQHIPGKICILAPNSSMKKSLFPYGLLYFMDGLTYHWKGTLKHNYPVSVSLVFLFRDSPHVIFSLNVWLTLQF